MTPWEHWWGLALHGALAILFGILFLTRPAGLFRGLVFALGVWTFLDGASALGSARRGQYALIVEGFVGIAVGATLLFVFPRATGNAPYLLVAGWALITGVTRVIRSTRLPDSMRNEVWLALSGLVTVLFGVLMMVMPHVVLSVLALWIGIFALVMGISLVASSLHLHHWETARI
jgi:uncharacterized membrane protein HdeD (DUF308 family)